MLKGFSKARADSKRCFRLHSQSAMPIRKRRTPATTISAICRVPSFMSFTFESSSGLPAAEETRVPASPNPARLGTVLRWLKKKRADPEARGEDAICGLDDPSEGMAYGRKRRRLS